MSTTTSQVYKPIVDHGAAHAVAIEKMKDAILHGDTEAMHRYFDEAVYHAQAQSEASIQARRYFLGKVKHG